MTTSADDGVTTSSAGLAARSDRRSETESQSRETTRVEHTFKSLLADFRNQLESDLREWLAEKERLATTESQAAHELTGVLLRFVDRDGKRIRPALLYYTYQACRGPSDDKAMTMAMALLMP